MTKRKPQPSKKLRAYIVEPVALASTLDTAPDFGPSNPPKESVAAGQTVRVVKDILHCGKHKIGFDEAGNQVYWTVTPQKLAAILKDFKLAKSINSPANLGKTHGNDDLLIHPDDLIAPVDDLRIAGDVLWMSSYVSPEQAEYLKNPARLVSPAFIPNYERAGHRFTEYLTHVAVTDRPVQTNQLPFLAMADKAGGGSMDFAAIVEIVNKLLEKLGMGKLPEDISEETFVPTMQGVLTAMGETAAETETTGTTVPTEGTDMGTEMAMPGIPAQMADTLRKIIKGLDDRVVALSDELATRRKADATAAKSAFHTEAGRLLGSGVPKAVIDKKIALADKLGSYDVALLDGLAPTLNTGRNSMARKLADGSPPQLGTEPTAEERRKTIAKEIAARRNISEEAALKFVPVV